MTILSKLFGKNNKKTNINIQFGRFTDAYKHKDKYDAWENSLEYFESGKLTEAYTSFFQYLKDDEVDNVALYQSEKGLEFELFQGSKVINGNINNQRVYAEAKIARSKGLHIGFLRKLLEENYQLEYCRYALDDDHQLTAIFTSYTVDASPYKIYAALKELATRVDYNDDLLVDEFSELEPIHNGHIVQNTPDIKKVKHHYLKQEIKEALQSIDNAEIDFARYPGAASFLYLDTLYKIDYLIKPEGHTMELIQKYQNLYFNERSYSPVEKNAELRKGLEEIASISFEDLEYELYDVKSTFGTARSSSIDQAQEFIRSEIKNMDFYIKQIEEDIAISIASYTLGYIIHHYALPVPFQKFIHLFYQITEQDYFNALGANIDFISEAKLSSRGIKKAIKIIIEQHDKLYPHISLKGEDLNFDNKAVFCKTYAKMLSNLNFKRADNR